MIFWWVHHAPHSAEWPSSIIGSFSRRAFGVLGRPSRAKFTRTESSPFQVGECDDEYNMEEQVADDFYSYVGPVPHFITHSVTYRSHPSSPPVRCMIRRAMLCVSSNLVVPDNLGWESRFPPLPYKTENPLQDITFSMHCVWQRLDGLASQTPSKL